MLFFSLAVRFAPNGLLFKLTNPLLMEMPVVFRDVGRIVISFLATFTMFMNANPSITLLTSLHSDRKADKIIEVSRD
jgi:hypothetical protein